MESDSNMRPGSVTLTCAPRRAGDKRSPHPRCPCPRSPRNKQLYRVCSVLGAAAMGEGSDQFEERLARARAKIYIGPTGPLGAHGNVNAAQNLQGISISRFSSDVVRGLYFEYWHLDADRGAGLADLSAKPFRVLSCVGSVSCRHTYLPLLANRRRCGGSG